MPYIRYYNTTKIITARSINILSEVEGETVVEILTPLENFPDTSVCKYINEEVVVDDLLKLKSLKSEKKAKVKIEASKRIEKDFPDFKLLRHIGQKEAGITTTMSSTEFIDFEQSRQSIRDASDTIETEIDNKNKDDLIGFDIEKHPAWP